MTLTIRTQLEAYEEGLMKESPFSEIDRAAQGNENRVVDERAGDSTAFRSPSSDNNQADSKRIEEESATYQVKRKAGGETMEAPDAQNQAISLFDEPAAAVAQTAEQIDEALEWLLTPELALGQAIDPMIGMGALTPNDFM